MADPTASTARTPLWTILAGLVLAIGLGYGVAATAPDFTDLALGDDTRPVYGRYAGRAIAVARGRWPALTAAPVVAGWSAMLMLVAVYLRPISQFIYFQF